MAVYFNATMLGVVVLSFGTGLFFAFLVSRYGERLGLVDIPNVRSSHTVPTPRGGGIGIPIIAGGVTFLLAPSFSIMVGLALVLSVFALIDDKKGLPVIVRFLLQMVLALVLVLVYRGDLLRSVEREWGVLVMVSVVFIAVIFITASTNFFNFMDGIDGISGFMAVVSFGLLGVYHVYYGAGGDFLLLCAAVVFSAVGFLFMNFPKGRVFMGDVGSIFIGNLFAFVVIFRAGSIKEFLLLTLFQGTMYLDCVSTIILRLFNRENILQAHKKHLYQHLVHGVGWPHARVTLVFSSVQLLAGVGAIFLYKYHVAYLAGLWLFLVIVYWLIRPGPRKTI